MRVTHAPTGEEHLALVSLVVAIRILEEFGFAGVNDDDAAIRENKSGGDAQLVGENRELVRPPVAVRVLADFQTIMSLASRLKVVGVIDRFGNPESASLIPGEPDGFHDVRFVGEETHLKFGKRGQVFHRLGRVERHLHRANRLALGAPLCVRRVVGQRGRRLDVFERLQTGAWLELCRCIGRRPTDAILDQCLKTGIRPGAFVMAPSGIKHPALAVLAHPGIGFDAFVIAALGEHDPVGIVFCVNVILVPAPDRRKTGHHRVVRHDNRFLEHAGGVALELPAHQLDVFGGIEETIGSAVKRN